VGGYDVPNSLSDMGCL